MILLFNNLYLRLLMLAIIFVFCNFINMQSIAYCAEEVIENTTENENNAYKTYFYILSAITLVTAFVLTYFYFSDGATGSSFDASNNNNLASSQTDISPLSIDQIIYNNVSSYIGDKNIIAEQQKQIEHLKIEHDKTVRSVVRFINSENNYRQIILRQKSEIFFLQIVAGISYTTTFIFGIGLASALTHIEVTTGLPTSTVLYHIYAMPFILLFGNLGLA